MQCFTEPNETIGTAAFQHWKYSNGDHCSGFHHAFHHVCNVSLNPKRPLALQLFNTGNTAMGITIQVFIMHFIIYAMFHGTQRDHWHCSFSTLEIQQWGSLFKFSSCISSCMQCFTEPKETIGTVAFQHWKYSNGDHYSGFHHAFHHVCNVSRNPKRPLALQLFNIGNTAMGITIQVFIMHFIMHAMFH